MCLFTFFSPIKRKALPGLLLLGTLLLSFHSHAQTEGVISGTVTDDRAAPLPEILVLLNGGLHQTTTDKEGGFGFRGLTDGTYAVRVRYFDFTEEKSVVVKGGKTTRLRFSIKMQLDTVTVSLNRKTIPSSTLRLSENLLVTPQNIQVIDGNMIQDQMLLSTAEGFTRNVSGARTVYHQEEGSAGIYVRGYGASNLRNGMDVSGSFGPLREDMAFVERIEFVKGPAGFMMGNTQPGGFYNIVTKKPKGKGEATARLTLGSFGLYRGEADVDAKLSKDGRFLGRFNVMGTQKGSHVMHVSHEQYVFNPSFKYVHSDKTDITLEYIYSQNAFTGGFSKYAYGLHGFKEVPVSFSFSDPILKPTVVREHNLYGTINHLLSEKWMLTGQFGYIN